MPLKTNCFKLILFCFLLCVIGLESVEDSVVPAITTVETIENISSNKYSRNHYLEITSSLSRLDEKVRIVSYNVLFNIHDESLEEVNRWPQRLPRLVELIGEMAPDIICVQELYPNQARDLLPFLAPIYQFYAMPRENGELNGIFYRKGRFEAIECKSWITDWAKKELICDSLTMVHFKDHETGKEFAIFNTHLSFSKPDKRESQTHFILQEMNVYASKMPVLLTGDLNTFPHRQDLGQLPFYDGDYIHRLLTKDLLKNAKEISLLGHLGPIATFSNEGEDPTPFKGRGTPGVFLDHIYVSKGIQIIIHAVQSGTVNGHFPSDHLPILVDFIVE